MIYSQYTWLFVISIILGLFVAWGIGANDVANSFGTSVGARALTMKQAILVASVCEFGGAVLLGSGVTDTIKSGIADINDYQQYPDLLMFGMVCALFATGIWLALATFLELPVSTTHAIVGAIIGFSLVARGGGSIIWVSDPPPGSPFPGGVVSIILAWFLTPAMAAIVAALLFLFTKYAVLHSRHPFQRSLILFPVYTLLTAWIICFFIIQKGVNAWMAGREYSAENSVGVVPYSYPTCPPQAVTSDPMKNSTSSTVITFAITGCHVPDSANAWISTIVATGLAAISVLMLKYVVRLVNRDLKAIEDAEEAKIRAREAAVVSALERAADRAMRSRKVAAEQVALAAAMRASRDVVSRASISTSTSVSTASANGQGGGGGGGFDGIELANNSHRRASPQLDASTSEYPHGMPPLPPQEQHQQPEEEQDEYSAVATATNNRTPMMLQSVRRSKVWTSLSHPIIYGTTYDIHQSVEDDVKIMRMHHAAEMFDRKTELSFKYLQVCTACANSFAHGANDVANAIGSVAAVYSIWQCSCSTSTALVPVWMFVLGGAGLVFGLSTYGYKIIRALGVKLTKLSNARGYCAELTSAIIVIVASRYGFPVSTTQVITGAITGIGLAEVITARLKGDTKAAGRFNFSLLLKFFLGWVATLLVSGLTSALFMTLGVFTPNKTASVRVASQGTLINTTNAELAVTFSEQATATSSVQINETELAQQAAALNASTSQFVTQPILDLTEPLESLVNATDFMNSTLFG